MESVKEDRGNNAIWPGFDDDDDDVNNFSKNKVRVSGQLCSQTAHFGGRKSVNPFLSFFFRVSPRDLQL